MSVGPVVGWTEGRGVRPHFCIKVEGRGARDRAPRCLASARGTGSPSGQWVRVGPVGSRALGRACAQGGASVVNEPCSHAVTTGHDCPLAAFASHTLPAAITHKQPQHRFGCRIVYEFPRHAPSLTLSTPFPVDLTKKGCVLVSKDDYLPARVSCSVSRLAPAPASRRVLALTPQPCAESPDPPRQLC